MPAKNVTQCATIPGKVQECLNLVLYALSLSQTPAYSTNWWSPCAGLLS